MSALCRNEQLAIGMTVYDASGDKLGTLVDADAWVLVVEHGFFFPTEISVPLAAVERIDADGVWLSWSNDEIERSGEDAAAVVAAQDDPALALG